MFAKLAVIKSKLKLKEQRIRTMVTTYQGCRKEKARLRLQIEKLTNLCATKKLNLQKIHEEMGKVSLVIHEHLQGEQGRLFDRSCRTLEIVGQNLTNSLATMTRLLKVTPYIFDDRMLKDELVKGREKAQKLHKDCYQKRFQLQKFSRDRMTEYHGLVEQTQLIMDVLWDLSELKKEEEDAEVIVHNHNLALERKNEEIRNRMQNRVHSFNYFHF